MTNSSHRDEVLIPVLGQRLLAEAIAANGWTQGELARRLKAPRGIVCRWLKGERTPGLGYALALQRETGVPVESWLVPSVTDLSQG
jgi:transcriptional regulator with XRE-family HTH domain